MATLRCITTSIVFLLVLCLPAQAGILVSIAPDLPSGNFFLVRTDLIYSDQHGSHHDPIGSAFLQTGQQETLSVLPTSPPNYDQVTAIAVHPAYLAAEVSAHNAPDLLRTVNLPPLAPLSWRRLLASGTPLHKGGAGITAGAVNDHFRMILRDYLPAFDRAEISEDLRPQLPLLRDLAAFAQTPQALQNSLRNRHQMNGEGKDRSEESVRKAETGYRVELQRRLKEIEAWLALPLEQRRPMHDWIEKFHRPDYVFNRIMQDADRRKILALLRESEKPGHWRQHSWLNRTTRVKFFLSLDRHTTEGYRTTLITDLNPRLGLEKDTAYQRKCFPIFIKGPDNNWQLK